MNSPFSLPIGEVINVKMIAYNFYGESSYSPIASNQNVVWKPDAVINLRDNTAVTKATRIGLLWEDGQSDNGRPILDYTITYD